MGYKKSPSILAEYALNHINISLGLKIREPVSGKATGYSKSSFNLQPEGEGGEDEGHNSDEDEESQANEELEVVPVVPQKRKGKNPKKPNQ